ncbi:MAG: DUF1622 domain-containing protein [Xanthobacteraceae bacterium]
MYELIETTGSYIDVIGVGLIILGFLIATLRYLSGLFSSAAVDLYTRYRQDVGRAILLGLEVLVAGDIIRTVAVTPTLTSVAVLAWIVVIRTVLSFSLQTELEGRLPWQARPSQPS